MNTANLQLEGVYAILSALLGIIREKGLLNEQEIDQLLLSVEKTSKSDSSRPAEIRDANVDAICFPARFLRCALQASSEGRAYSFSQLASQVGQMKSDPR
jgi:hypothetical protein